MCVKNLQTYINIPVQENTRIIIFEFIGRICEKIWISGPDFSIPVLFLIVSGVKWLEKCKKRAGVPDPALRIRLECQPTEWQQGTGIRLAGPIKKEKVL
jgi:hypothetical protein